MPTGNAQCDQNIIIGGGVITVAQVNTTIVPACFNCLLSNGQPATAPVVFMIGEMVLPTNDAFIITGHQLIVSNFTGLPTLIDGRTNDFKCHDSSGNLGRRTVTTLSKEC